MLTVNARISRRACAIGACGLAALAAVPAAEAQTASVRAGRNISVFANVGFVAAFGYTVDSPMKVELAREGHVIARAAGPAVLTPEGGGLEVNHGPAGAPRPGDCWSNFTPRLLPGDEVRVSGDGATDTTLVDNIVIAGDPVLAGDDVVVEGTARYADGTPIPPEALNSGESRHVGPRVRANPTKVERIALTEDGWRATYEAAAGYGVFDVADGVTPTQIRDAILNGDHAIGYGHVVPLPPVTQLAEGVGDRSGPALGCEGSPLAPADAITTISDDVVNLAGGDLTVGGVSTPGSVVSVTLDDASAATAPVVVAADRGPSGAWSASVSRAQLESLRDGTLTVSASVGANTLSLPKDTTAPAPITATPAPGTYTAGQFVTLSTGDATDAIRFTRNGTPPTASSPRATNSISVPASQTLTAFATDAAGNAGAAQTFAYAIVEPVADAGPSGGAGAGQTTVLTTAAAVPGPLTATAAAAARSRPYLRSLGTSPRVRRSIARRRGIRVVMRVADDANVVRIRVLRRLPNGYRLPLATSLRSPARAGAFRVRLSDRRLRRQLRIGTYEVEATPGASRRNLGTPSRYRFGVVRG